MDAFFFDDINNIWMKSVKRADINEDEAHDIRIISMLLINEFSDTIHNVTNQIIHKELIKRPNASLCQQILIKRQVINNISQNFTSITINMAKEKLDTVKNMNTMIASSILPIIDETPEEIEMITDDFNGIDYYSDNNNGFSYVLPSNMDWSENSNQDEDVDIIV